MEKRHFLADYVEGEKREDPRPWYNGAGDCVIFQLKTDTEIFAERIDELLTIYRDIETEKPVGFQIKDVAALLRKFGLDSISIKAAGQSDEIRSISMGALVLSAYENGPKTISRRTGYAEAVQSFSTAQELDIPQSVAAGA